MATIKDVAKEAGVSIATTSRVINNAPHTSETAIAAVKAAMEKLGYRPNANARALVSKSSNAIGVLVNDVSAPFFGSMIKAIDAVASEQGKQLLIGNGYHDATKERNAINLLINSRCESLVVHSKGISDEELVKLANEVPGMVLINRIVPNIENRCIALDNRRGSYIATEYLIKNGHKHIGYICSSHDIEDAHDRLSGYLDALKEYGIESNDEYIEYGEPDELGGEQAMINLMAKNTDITAIATYNDYMAAGSLALLQENGVRIPEDMSVIGFDDGHIARFIYPRLTTIRYPIQVMANQAVKLSLRLVSAQQKENSQHKQFMPILVRRSSVRNMN
ncbi:LacI family DNA-binding transcriptional regulator [Agarivorans sp. B2Z047]|uniref:substrate-binding domain-containing protein n=1 Tax=Agarivorans sp. B2Z047 TaxID=2652721 RepID=UPI00128DFDF2|nr:substrate-binding domain-containing protein [Agarivorans sp. B2Z047]MPW31812.1 LacI family DNA-binding transcriptional regulator [Agarivorans sp. B2Z047]UQN43721.1 substrate-binding domain-containing protein [Agarivorans sp. B2Z047]